MFVVLNEHVFLIVFFSYFYFFTLYEKKNVRYPWQPLLCFGIYQHKNLNTADVNRLNIIYTLKWI